MKLSLKLNLEPARQRAIDAVNAWAEAQARKAARAVEAAMQAGLDAVREGVSEYHIAAEDHRAALTAVKTVCVRAATPPNGSPSAANRPPQSASLPADMQPAAVSA